MMKSYFLNAIYFRSKWHRLCEWMLLQIFLYFFSVRCFSAIEIPEELHFCSDVDVQWKQMRTIAKNASIITKTGKMRQYEFYWRVDHTSFSANTIRWMAFIRWEWKNENKKQKQFSQNRFENTHCTHFER